MHRRNRTAAVEISGDRMVRHRPGGKQIYRVSGDELRWAVVEYVPQDLTDRLARSRSLELKMPLGDPENVWIKVAEYPLTWLNAQVPMSAWDDRKAMARRVVNNRDYRRLRADSDTRVW
jgi:hypothetical protein